MIEISEKVKNALFEKKPVVALESTILTHGFKKPYNFELALKSEKIISSLGVTPATIAIIDGKIKIGLSRNEIELICSKNNLKKISIMDLSSCIFRKSSGGTTVAATLYIAELCNIKVFVTGGIGGVHRGFKNTFDISSDLNSISKSKIFTICSGPKAVLDVPKTIEHIETLGIQLFTYKSKNIPLFWSSDSNIKSINNINCLKDFAHIYNINQKLSSPSGILIFNPIPKKHEIPYKKINPIISSALKKMKNKNISGKEVTPFLLREIEKRTNGLSIGSNKELLYNNATIGAKLSLLLRNEEDI